MHRPALTMALWLLPSIATAQGTLTEYTLEHGGLTRRYLEHRPSPLPSAPLPVVVVLHGGTETAEGAAALDRPTGHWRQIADREGLIVLYPDSVAGNWNDCGQFAYTGTSSTHDDVGFLEQMLRAVESRHAIDSQRIYSTGSSNGGLLSYRLALEQSSRYAGHGGVIALPPVDGEAECRPSPVNPSSIVMQVGTTDPLIPFTGSARNLPFATARDQFLHWNGCVLSPTITVLPDLVPADQSIVQVHDFVCPGNATYSALVAVGGGHSPPSLQYPLPGLQNRDIEIAEAIWSRLRDQRLGPDRFFSSNFESLNQMPFEFASTAIEFNDPARNNREVGARILAPVNATGIRRLVFISHGGLGTNPAVPGVELTNFSHIAEPVARLGMVAVVVGHRSSGTLEQHRLDRPGDVSFLIDQFAAGLVPLPAGFVGQIDTVHVGHTGQSAGAYTSMALGGATYPYGQFRDPRVVAIAPISPQGVGEEFLAYDNGPNDNTWVSINVPTLIMLGRDELDSTGTGAFVSSGWRLLPFARLSEAFDRQQVIIDDQDHLEMGGNPNNGTPSVRSYIGDNIARFFAVYLAAEPGSCEVGTLIPPAGIPIERATKVAADGRLYGCPSP